MTLQFFIKNLVFTSRNIISIGANFKKLTHLHLSHSNHLNNHIRNMSSVINWEVNPEKISSLTKNIIADTKKRCQDIINAPEKNKDILKVFIFLIVFMFGLLDSFLINRIIMTWSGYLEMMPVMLVF